MTKTNMQKPFESSSKKRNCKWVLSTLLESSFIDQVKVFNRTLNDLSIQIFEDITTDRISSVHVRGGGVKKDLTYGGAPMTKSTLKDIYTPIFEKNGWAEKIEAFKTDTLEHVLNRYQGYMKRNKTVSELIKFKVKDVHYKGAYVKDEEGCLHFTTPQGGSFSHALPYTDNVGCLVNKQYLKSNKFGGNLNVEQKAFVAAVEIPWTPAYEPTNWVGTDINKRDTCWLVVGSVIYKKPEHISTLEKAIAEVQVEINKPKGQRYKKEDHYDSKQRRGLRKRWKKLHKKHKKAIKNFLDPILKDIERNHSGLVIDGVTTGAQNGSFGQDKIVDYLITECEDRCIPCYVPPTSYTSQRCASCGHVERDNRKSADEFKCLDCGHEAQPDLNAVENYQFIGTILHEQGHPFGYYGTPRSRDERVIRVSNIKEIFNLD